MGLQITKPRRTCLPCGKLADSSGVGHGGSVPDLLLQVRHVVQIQDMNIQNVFTLDTTQPITILFGSYDDI